MDDQRHIRVLLVDDEESSADIVARGLREQQGIHVTIALGGAEAIAVLGAGAHQFDVLILDYRMPGITGLDVLRWMKENGVSTPAFLLTGAGSESVAVEAMKLGAYDYCRKDETDLPHLLHLIEATHERHMFRVNKAMEREQAHEILLDLEATDVAQQMVNSIAPVLNSGFAHLAVDLEGRAEELVSHLPEDQRTDFRQLFWEMQQDLRGMETAVRGLLKLYEYLYARHPAGVEIERIRQEYLKEMSRRNEGSRLPT